MKGLVIKGVGSFYTVKLADGSECICRLRGRLRLTEDTVFTGDYVDVEYISEHDNGGVISEVYPRKNQLIRPPVANIDCMAIVLTASRPKPDLTLVDKLTFLCEKQGITPVLIINKNDINDPDYIDAIIEDYASTGYMIIKTSAHTGEGITDIKRMIAGQVTCFSGQSGVGKSSLLNAIMPGINLAVGDVSARSSRGRHTTRETRLFSLADGGILIDSPGFSLLENIALEPSELSSLYPEMRPIRDECRFYGCLHVSEPDCAVKSALSDGRISHGRYERYKRMVDELIEKDKHKYDR